MRDGLVPVAWELRFILGKMRAGIGNKTSTVLASILIAGFVVISSCEQEEKIIYVPREVPADCPPSAPRGLFAINLDGYVSICWFPNPEDNIEGYYIWKNDSLYGVYDAIGWMDAGDEIPYEYCFDHSTPYNQQFYYAVSAMNSDGFMSELSYEELTATPRPEGYLKLYDAGVYPDSSGYDFSTLSNRFQNYQEATTDIWYETGSGRSSFTVKPVVHIQDYGYSNWFDDINTAPDEGWSPSGEVEVIEGHFYMLKLGESDGYHYVKLWVDEVNQDYTVFYWAYQTDPGNRDLAPGMTTSQENKGLKRIGRFPNGRRDPQMKMEDSCSSRIPFLKLALK
jgi:hypothetical protein